MKEGKKVVRWAVYDKDGRRIGWCLEWTPAGAVSWWNRMNWASGRVAASARRE